MYLILVMAKEFETKFTETVRLPSQGFEVEAYMYVPYLEADTTHLLFLLKIKVLFKHVAKP